MIDLIKDKVPENSLDYLQKITQNFDLQLKITANRQTKLGDYRQPFKKQPHRISINENLNPYSFLITLVHEIAHLYCWEKHKNKIAPHGKEWKNQLRILLIPLLENKIFPEDITKILKLHIKNPRASTFADSQLYLTLKKYDVSTSEKTIYLSDIPENSLFLLANNRTFKKGKLRRTRFQCEEISTRKKYLIHRLATVLIVDKS